MNGWWRSQRSLVRLTAVVISSVEPCQLEHSLVLINCLIHSLFWFLFKIMVSTVNYLSSIYWPSLYHRMRFTVFSYRSSSFWISPLNVMMMKWFIISLPHSWTTQKLSSGNCELISFDLPSLKYSFFTLWSIDYICCDSVYKTVWSCSLYCYLQLPT